MGYSQIGGLYVPYGTLVAGQKPNRKTYTPRYPDVPEDQLIDRCGASQQARFYFRTNSLARACHDRLVDGICSSTGLIPQAKTSSPAWNEEAEAWFNEWAKVSDYRQRDNLVTLQRLATSHLVLDGEMFFLLLSNGQLQAIEPSRIATPKGLLSDPYVIDGVRLNREGIALGYYVADRSTNGYPDTDRATFVGASDIIHIRRNVRADQVRGMSAYLPILGKLAQMADYQEALLTKAQLEAKRAYAVHTEGEASGPGNLGDRIAGWASGNATDGGSQYEYINDAEVYYLSPNEKISALESNTPHANHVPYIDALTVDICSAMGISPEWVSLKYQTSYIASKGALISTAQTIDSYQFTLESQMMQRLWNWRIAKAIKAGELLPAPSGRNGASEWYRTHFVYPRMVALDRGDEAAADAQQWRNGTTSLTRQAKEYGVEYTEILAERVAEAKAIMTAAETNGIPLYMLLPPPAGLNTQDYQAAPSRGRKEYQEQQAQGQGRE